MVSIVGIPDCLICKFLSVWQITHGKQLEGNIEFGLMGGFQGFKQPLLDPLCLVCGKEKHHGGGAGKG